MIIASGKSSPSNSDFTISEPRTEEIQSYINETFQDECEDDLFETDYDDDEALKQKTSELKQKCRDCLLYHR